MPRLIHLNGAPAVGKSTLARRLADQYPPTLCLDIDTIRSMIGCTPGASGNRDEGRELKLLGRRLGLAMAQSHLRAGHDVIVPQLLFVDDFVEQMEHVAYQCGADFVEVVLTASETTLRERFAARREEFRRTGRWHPEAEVSDVDRVITDSVERFSANGSRPRAHLIPAHGTPDETFAALLGALAPSPSELTEPTEAAHAQGQ